MRLLISALVLGSLATASAAQRPVDVFAVVESASPAAELAAWSKALTSLNPNFTGTATNALMTVEMLPGVLGKFVGASKLDGIEFGKPMQLVLLDPQKYPQPVVLSVAVKKIAALQSSAKAAHLTVNPSQGYAVVGAAPAVAASLAFIQKLPHASKVRRGLHGVAYAEPIWAAYGAQMTAMKSVLAAIAQQQAQQGAAPSPISGEMLTGMYDGLLSALGQSSELSIDLHAEPAALELVLGLLVKPGSALDGAFSTQRPSSFALAEKLAEQSASLFAVGDLNFGPLIEWSIDVVFGGSQADPQLRTAMADLAKEWDGTFAIAGDMLAPGKMEYQYLMGAKDPRRIVELFPTLYRLMSRSGMMNGAIKMVETPKAPFNYDGLQVRQTEFTYDFSSMQIANMPKQVKAEGAWAGWEKLLAFTMGSGAADRLRSLIDSARHGRARFALDARARAGLARARAGKESAWMRIDLNKIAASAGSPTSIPAGWMPEMAFGFGPQTAHLRITVGDLTGTP